MITKNVKLYLGDGFPVRIPVSQYDTMWQFVFTIIRNSQPWQIPTGATAVLNGRKPDGNVFAFAGTIENNTVTVDADVQMTAVAGQTVCELSILADGKTVGTANFILDVEEAPKSADDVVSDTVLDGYGMMVTNAVDIWLNSHSGQIGGLTNEAKQALLTLLAHVAYTDDQGQTYIDALEDALYPPADLLSISAVFNQGDNEIYDTDSLDTLKQYLTVTANMSDGTTQTVNNYTLSGTLTEGTSTITVSYDGKTATFGVTVELGWTWKYKASDGQTLTQRTDLFTVDTNNFTQTFTEEVTDGYLRLFAGNDGGKKLWKFSSAYPQTNNNAIMEMRIKYAQVAFASEYTNLQIQLSDGTGGAKIGATRYDGKTGSPSFVTIIGTAITKAPMFELNSWHTIRIEIKNGTQSVYIDGESVVNNQQKCTSYCIYNRIFMQAPGIASTSTPSEVFIDYIAYKNYD